MATYLETIDRIKDELVNEAITDAQIKNAIKDAIKTYERKAFYFNRRQGGTFATVAGQEYYGAAANAEIPNIVRVDFARVLSGSSYTPVSIVDDDTISGIQTGTATGDPEALSYVAQTVRLYPIPNAALTISMNYTYRFATLSADTDTNAWLDDAEQMIRAEAKAILYMDVLADPEIAMTYRGVAGAQENELLAEGRRRIGKILAKADSAMMTRANNILTGAA